MANSPPACRLGVRVCQHRFGCCRPTIQSGADTPHSKEFADRCTFLLIFLFDFRPLLGIRFRFALLAGRSIFGRQQLREF